MPTPDEYILAGLLERDTNHVEVAKRLTGNIEAFLLAGGHSLLQDTWPQRIAEIAVKYNRQTADFLSLDELINILRSKGASAEDVTTAQFTFAQAVELQVPPQKFRFWIKEIQEQDRALTLADKLQSASEILEGKVTNGEGVVYSGAIDAIHYLSGELATLSANGALGTQPGGNIRAEKEAMLIEIDRAERGLDVGGRIRTGFTFLDDVTGGLDLSDFLLVGAYTGEGKSQWCANAAWHATVMQGLNVLVVTAETARTKYRRRILNRHTHKPGVGIIGGIPSNILKSGQWESDEQRRKFVDILHDFTDNPSYGVLDVTQVSSGSTLADIRTHAINFQRAYNKQLHVLVVDYLALLRSERARQKRQEELNDILQTFKELCLTFDHGAGVLGIAAHQMKQDARENAKPEFGKFYSIRDFSDTSEAGKSVDVAVALLRTDELKKLHEVAAGVLKNRDGEVPSEIFRLFEDYGSSYLGNISKVQLG